MSASDMASTNIVELHDQPEAEVAKMHYSLLGETGMKVSAIAFGASPLGTSYNTAEVMNEETNRAALENALKNGINYIDTAPWYGHGKSEEVLGRILKGIPRSSYYIATKVGRYEKNVEDMFDFSAERVTRSVDESLARLGLDYVDIVQVHDVEFAPDLDIILMQTLPALKKVREAGKARFIGITGYPIKTLRDIVEQSTVKIDTVLSYCHLDLNDSSLLQHVPYFKEKKIGLISASPLSMALLTPGGPAPWHPASKEIRDTCRAAAKYCREQGVDIAKLAVHFATSHAAVSTILIGMDRPQFVEQNLDAVLHRLSDKEEEVLRCIQERFFPDTVSRSWEGVEVAKYWRKLRAKQEDKQ